LYQSSRTKGYSKKAKRFAHLRDFEREKKATAKNQKKRKKAISGESKRKPISPHEIELNGKKAKPKCRILKTC